MATISYETNGVTSVIFFDATMSENHEGTAEVTEHEVERGADLADHVRPQRAQLSLEVMITNTPIASSGRLIGEKVTMEFGPPEAVKGLPEVNRIPRDAKVKQGYVSPFLFPAGLNPTTPNRIVQAQLGPGQLRPDDDSFFNGSPRLAYPTEVVNGVHGRNELVYVTAQVFTFLNPRDRLVDLWEALNKLRTEGTLCTVSTRLQDYQNMLITRIGAPVEARDAIQFGLQFKEIGFADSLTFATVDKAKIASSAKKAQPKKDLGPKKTYKLKSGPQSVVDMTAQSLAGHRTPDEVLADHPNPTSQEF